LLLDGKIDDETDGSSPDTPSRAWAIGVSICCGLPLYLIFSASGNAGRGTAAICFGGAIIIATRLRWDLRNRAWFWVVVVLMVLVQLAMILLIPWPNKNYTLPIVLPVGILDILAISYVIKLVAKKMGPAETKGDDSPRR
jgi:hypothetical protein